MQHEPKRPATASGNASGRQYHEQTPGSPAAPTPAADLEEERNGATDADDPRFARLQRTPSDPNGARKD